MAQQIETADELKYQFQPAPNGVLNFAVRAANDAHIALTSGPEESDPMYEVFIGGWSNSKSVIRKNRTKPDVAEVETPGILSSNEFRRFWIKWQNGSISAGKENESEPFLTFSDTENVPIGYYGICTGWGASGTWLIEGLPREGLTTTPDCGEFLTYTFYPVLQGYLEFEVKASGNAHMALTSGPKETDPMYEVILGGWKNTASAIRYRRGNDINTMVQEVTPALLSAGEYRHFTIMWRNGEIRVLHRGGLLMTWTDPAPFGISHFGVHTGHGDTGVWRIHKIPIGFNLFTISATESGTPKEDEGEEELRETNNEDDGEAEEGDGEEPADEEGIILVVSTVGFVLIVLITIVACISRFFRHFSPHPAPVPSAPPAGMGNVTWERRANGEIPDGAVQGGVDIETGETLYIGRAEHEGAVIPGKFVPSHGVTYVAWGGSEHGKPEYEILCGCEATWVKCQDGEVPPNALEGGRSEDGEVLYIGRINDGDKLALGKVQASHKVCYIPYGGSELAYPEYEVLVGNQ